MTKRILEILVIVLVFKSCQPKSEDRSNGNLQFDETTKVIEPNLKSNSSSSQNIKMNYKDSCDCDWVVEKLSHYSDLTFSNNGNPFNVHSLTDWSDNTARLNIKSLRLVDFDTIPTEMKIFENVESVYLEAINHKNVQGLDIFPKLKIIKAEEERFELNEDSKWIESIEVFYANKTKLSGLESFNQMPNLREIRLSFSGFDTFPSDFDKLKCLSYFQTGAHSFCEIDLTQLDLNKLPCLDYVEFQSWQKNLKGIPNGIRDIKTLKISHPNLTKSDKDKLKEIGEYDSI